MKPRGDPGDRALTIVDFMGILHILQGPEHLHQVRGRVITAGGFAPASQQVSAHALDELIVGCVDSDAAHVHGPPVDQGRHGISLSVLRLLVHQEACVNGIW